ncbi:MAG TPA: hypothetical protein ENF26_04225, partial [Methanomicrobia archaeon]|nr:hypothetical protein [Methanomicrobia archaeon]HEX59338.1 hypothetical protein [Methanomicrobia archaeon]
MMHMKVRSALTQLVVLTLVTTVAVSIVAIASLMPPPLPTAFSGSVIVDNATAPTGTNVTAEVVGAVGNITGNVTTVADGEYELVI